MADSAHSPGVATKCKPERQGCRAAPWVLNPSGWVVSNTAMMKQAPILRLVLVSLVLMAAGCASTPAQRIAGSKAFDTYPSAIQEKILNGEVDVGFTEEMVRLALGEPDRVTRRETAQGDSEVWGYSERKPRISLGFGVSGGGGHTRTGAGVIVGGRDWSDGSRIRVIFRDGKVTAVETRQV